MLGVFPNTCLVFLLFSLSNHKISWAPFFFPDRTCRVFFIITPHHKISLVFLVKSIRHFSFSLYHNLMTKFHGRIYQNFLGILLIPSLFQHKVSLIFFFLIQTCWLFFSSYRRGLSKHFQGKSQSFTSLSNVRCLGDLAKPENKKLKYCKSYSADLDSHRSHSTKVTSRTISKKASRGSCSTLHAKKNSFLNNRPPIPPHRTSTLCNQTPLFA